MITKVFLYRNFNPELEKVVVPESTLYAKAFELYGVTKENVMLDSRLRLEYYEDDDGQDVKTMHAVASTYEPELLADDMEIYHNYISLINYIILNAGNTPLRVNQYLFLGFIPLIMHPWLQDSDHQMLWESNFKLDIDKLGDVPRYTRRSVPILTNKYQPPSYCQLDTFVHRQDVAASLSTNPITLTTEEIWRKIWKT